MLTLVSQQYIPAAIPAANVHLTWPESFRNLPAVVVDQDDRQRSWEYLRPKVTREQHYVTIEFFTSPRIAGGIQQAKADIRAWIAASMALVRANRTLAVGGVDQVVVAGIDIRGRTMTWTTATRLDEHTQVPLAYGCLYVPIQDAEEVMP